MAEGNHNTIENKIQSVQDKYYKEHTKNTFFKKAQKKDCANRVVDEIGLLIAAHINKKYEVVGEDGLELRCRKQGLNVIHGGKNALRFTPHFLINEDEIELVKCILQYVFDGVSRK